MRILMEHRLAGVAQPPSSSASWLRWRWSGPRRAAEAGECASGAACRSSAQAAVQPLPTDTSAAAPVATPIPAQARQRGHRSAARSSGPRRCAGDLGGSQRKHGGARNPGGASRTRQ